MNAPIGKMASQAEATDRRGGQKVPVASFVVVKVVREHIPMYGDGTATFGELLDQHLRKAALDGAEVQSVEFEIAPEPWGMFAHSVRKEHGDWKKAE
jgi:hypothetical protein